MGETVIAEAVVRSPDGSSILDAPGPVTEVTIGRYRASDEANAEAAARLEALGIDVVSTGPTGLTISADREVFERTFGTASDPIAVPEELADLIAAIVLPQQPQLYP
jgi:serine protease AprX